MNSWTECVTRLLTWRGALPRQLHLRGIYIHVSTLLALPLAALAIFLVPLFTSLDGQWSVAALTIPVVWLASLTVRVLAQWLAIGSQSDFDLVVGPTGNISQDYDQLTGPNMMSYAVAGQSATMIMALLGVLLLGATTSSPGLTIASMLELQTGWHLNAWASQLIWVNTFLFGMHLLPSAPFDARALYVGWRHISQPGVSAGTIHRMLAGVNSHIGTAIAGFSLAMLVVRIAENQPAGIWHFLLMVSIYMFVVSQIEGYQGQQADELTEPPTPRRRQRPQLASYSDRSFAKFTNYDEDPLDIPSPHEVLDVDEILRKLHREGQDSLSAFEKEALLSASRELKARRQSQ